MITQAELLRSAFNPHDDQEVPPAGEKTKETSKETSQPTATTNNQEKLEKILESARKRVGLKPIEYTDIAEGISRVNINDPKYSEQRKQVAQDLIERELKIKDKIEIKSSKMSQGSPIPWIELEDIEIAEMLQHQASRMRNPNGQAIMYPPRNYTQV